MGAVLQKVEKSMIVRFKSYSNPKLYKGAQDYYADRIRRRQLMENTDNLQPLANFDYKSHHTAGQPAKSSTDFPNHHDIPGSSGQTRTSVVASRQKPETKNDTHGASIDPQPENSSISTGSETSKRRLRLLFLSAFFPSFP